MKVRYFSQTKHHATDRLADEGVAVLKTWPGQWPDKYHRVEVDRTKEKSSSEESKQSWKVGAQSQRMASLMWEDGEEFLRIFSHVHWSNYSS